MKISNFNRKIMRMIFSTAFLLSGLNIYVVGQDAQISISNPTGVNVCDVSETVQIEIENIALTSLTNVTVSIDLSTGIEYVASSLNDLSIYNLAEQNISDLSSIILSSDDLPADSTMSFTIAITANMDAITYQNSGGIFRNDVTVNYTGGSDNTLSSSYNLYYPVLSITNISPSSKSINSGDSFTREITVVNAGNGRVSAFQLTDGHGLGIEINSVDIGTLNANQDTILISGSDFNSIGNNDSFFDTNESITITESVDATGCETTTVTSTFTNIWGCNGSTIESSSSYAYTYVSLKTPNITVSTTSELDTCFAEQASVHTITLTNNGQGRAEDLELDIYKSRGSGYQQDIFSRIDESTITYAIDGGASGSLTPTSTHSTDNSGDYSCLGASPVGRVILDLPNLEPGDEMLITFRTYHCNFSVCDGEYIRGWKYELGYSDVCDENTYTKSGTGQSTNDTDMSLFPETPTDINNNETKEFIYTVSSHDNDLPAGNGARYKVVVDLPAGIAYSSIEFYHNVTWTPASVDYNTSLNEVTAYYDLPKPSGFNFDKASFYLDLTGDCNMAGAETGTVNVDLDIFYITDTGCSTEVPFVCDEAVSVDLHCPSGGPCEGMSFEEFTIERTSFGEPDNDLNGVPDGSGSLDLDRIKVNRAMYGDTLRSAFTGVVHTSVTNTSWNYGYASQEIEWGTYLTQIDVSVRIYDASASTYITCSNVPVSTSVNSLDKTFTYDISPGTLDDNCASFIGFTYNQGDSVWVYADYKVSTNIEGDVVQLKSTNNFYVSNTANPESGDQYQCGYYNDNFTLIGFYFLNSSRNYYTISSCYRRVNQNFYLSIGDCCSNYNGGNLFPSEYRNWAHIKSATVEIPDFYEVDNFSLTLRRTKKTNTSVTETVSSITPSSINGNLYTFDLEQYYEGYGGSVKLSDDGFRGTMYMDITPSCDVPLSTYQDITWRFNFAQSDFLGGGETGFIDASSTDRVRFSPPELELSSDDATLDGLTRSVSWDLKINTGSSSTDANNAWIHIKNPSGETNILYVIDDDSNDTIPINGDIYRLETVDGGTTRDLTIIGQYSSCVSDYITVYAGYECTEYPATFDDFICGFTTMGLYVEPKPAQMQATLEGAPVSGNCNSLVQIEIDVSSVQYASVDSIIVTINPVGESVTFESGSGQLQYPLSESYESVDDPSYSGGVYTYNLVDLDSTIAADGLPGVLDLDNNHFKLKFNMTVEESFAPGDYVNVNVAGKTICGEEIASINLAYDPSIGFQLATSSGLTNDITNSWSSSWGDYNNDGYDDLFITTYDDDEPNILYTNDGDGSFTKVTSGDIVTDVACSVAATWGDYDNDGYLDLFVANNVGVDNFLYHNNGNSTFTRITTGAIVEDGIYCHSAAWADYDNDGYLDLFVAEYFPTKTNHLFHNDGNGTFTKVEGSPVVTDVGHSIGAAWGDYNNDGLVDLFVPNTDNEPNWLYKNIGNGQFEKVNENVISTASNSVGCSWGDYNNDGYLDLFIANSGNTGNFLYVNNTDGTFTAITEGSIVTDEANSHGSTWVDIDNDGDQDLYVTNDQDQDNFLYRNEGDGTFTSIANTLTNLGSNSFGTSISDFDKDGDYDIYVANHSETTNFMFENIKGQCNEYLCLNLIGNNSNYSGIGARVRVKANIFGTDIWQMREVTAQSGGGAGSQNSLNVIFGLGDATSIDSLIIDWPSGYREVHTSVPSTSSDCNVYVEEDGAYVSGKAYIDANFNCQYDNGETLLKNTAITISPDQKMTYTDDNGEYSFYMNIGEYTISAIPPTYYSQYCPLNNGSQYVEVTEIGVSFPDNDFGFHAASSQPDLTVCLSTTILRVGFTNDFAVTYENIGTSAASYDTITMIFEPGIDIKSSTLPWDYKDGQSVYWYFTSIPPQTSVTFFVTDSVTSVFDCGDFATVSVEITSGTPEADYTNNSCTDEEEVFCAIDPNDKAVSPVEGILPGEALTYKIRFQNVGNYPAEHISIYDTLSQDLDIKTISNIYSSHKAVFTIVNESILIWDFKDINLPDSVHNEPESHGYVQFKIRPVENLPFGHVLENSATIVFDHFQYTATNNTVVRVKPDYEFKYESIDLVVFPQPTTDHLIVSFKSNYEQEIKFEFISNIGQVVYQEKRQAALGWNNFDFYLNDLERGVYFLNLISREGTNTRKIIKMN